MRKKERKKKVKSTLRLVVSIPHSLRKVPLEVYRKDIYKSIQNKMVVLLFAQRQLHNSFRLDGRSFKFIFYFVIFSYLYNFVVFIF